MRLAVPPEQHQELSGARHPAEARTEGRLPRVAQTGRHQTVVGAPGEIARPAPVRVDCPEMRVVGAVHLITAQSTGVGESAAVGRPVHLRFRTFGKTRHLSGLAGADVHAIDRAHPRTERRVPIEIRDHGELSRVRRPGEPIDSERRVENPAVLSATRIDEVELEPRASEVSVPVLAIVGSVEHERWRAPALLLPLFARGSGELRDGLSIQHREHASVGRPGEVSNRSFGEAGQLRRLAAARIDQVDLWIALLPRPDERDARSTGRPARQSVGLAVGEQPWLLFARRGHDPEIGLVTILFTDPLVDEDDLVSAGRDARAGEELKAEQVFRRDLAL